MAHYVVQPDDYAGWNPTGRYFVYASGAIGVIGLLSWLALHSHLSGFHPTAASDQVFLESLAWVGLGGFLLMLIAAFGSISLSRKARGTISITDEEVTRTIGNKTHTLKWGEIEGFVPMPLGELTLLSNTNKPNILIPRYVEDKRACFAELTGHGLQSVPFKRFHETRKPSRIQLLVNFIGVFLHPQRNRAPLLSSRPHRIFVCRCSNVFRRSPHERQADPPTHLVDLRTQLLGHSSMGDLAHGAHLVAA